MIEDKKRKKKEKVEVIEEKSSVVHYIFLVLAYIAFIVYLVIKIKDISDISNSMPEVIGWLFILVFLISLTTICVRNKKTSKGIVIIGSLLIFLYSLVNILISTNIISFKNDEMIPNFYNQSVLVVDEWKDKNNIKIIENHEYSDTIKKDYVISQDKVSPTLTKDITELIITISLGPDLSKEVIVPNYIGLKYDDVLKSIEENYLTNVKIEYQVSEKTKDTVISQSASGTMKRNDEIIITFAKSNEDVGEIEIIDFTGETKLYATSWLEKYGFKVEIKEDYSDEIEEGLVMAQSATNETKNPLEDVITLTISMGKEILAPDISSMKVDDINKWAIENNIRVSYKEEYNDEIKPGEVIETSIKEGEKIDKDKKLEITISKGKLEMIKLTNLSEFTNWAETNNISYDIKYENSSTVAKDEIIKCSHNTGDTIKKDDTVIITVSRGKEVTIPYFVGMSKEDIQSKCNSLNLSCSFKTGSYSETIKKGIATSQSKSSGTKVTEGSGITITLSAGIVEKVNVPSFVGKTKSEISSSCNSIGINCSFKYASGFNDKAKDTCISQSTTGKVNKGSSVTITLSNGPAKSYNNIIIQAQWLSECKGNVECSKTTIKNYFAKYCPGVTINFNYVKVTTNIGQIAQSSAYKANQPYTYVQGKTYTITLNTN